MGRKQFRPPARKILMGARTSWQPWRSPVLVEQCKLLPIDMQRIGVTVERIVHGLHYHETGRVLPATHKPAVIHGGRLKTIPACDRVHFERIFAPLEGGQWRTVGGRAFGYRFARAGDDPDSTVWFLSFFGCLMFLVFTAPD